MHEIGKQAVTSQDQDVMWPEVGKVTLKSKSDEVLSDEFLLKSYGAVALNYDFP